MASSPSDELDDFFLDAPALPPPHIASAAATPLSLLDLAESHDGAPASPTSSADTPRASSSSLSPVPPSPPPFELFPPLQPTPEAPAFPLPATSASAAPSASAALRNRSSPLPGLVFRPRLSVDVGALTSEPGGEGLLTPPSPLGLPGAYSGWAGVRRRKSSKRGGKADAKGKRRERDEAVEGELLLPPPFLDDQSSKESFDGILGARSARQAAQIARQHERLYALGRAPPPPFPQSLVRGFSKLVGVLGPPGGLDAIEGRTTTRGEGSGYEKQQRRRVRRAESGLKAFEVGQNVGKKFAARLRRRASEESRASERGFEADVSSPEEVRVLRPPLIAATPSLFLGSTSEDVYPSSSTDSSATTPPLPPVAELPPPRAPLLRPFIPDSPFLPPVETPLILGSAAEEDYFSLTRRWSRRKKKKASPTLAAIEERVASNHPPPTPSTFRLSIPASAQEVSRPYLWALGDLVVWVLIGSPPSPSSAGLDTSFASVSGLLGIVIHAIGFLFFVLYHAAALIAASYTALRASGVFLYWLSLNLTGRTEVSKAIVEYWGTCRAEWDKVCEQEEGGIGLSVWNAGRGLAELATLHSMTRDRWLREGPGHLVLLNGDEEEALDEVTPRLAPHRPQRSMHRRPSLKRPTFTMRESSYRWTDDDDRDGEGLVVTSSQGSVLEGTIISSSPTKRSFRKSGLSPMLVSRRFSLPGEPPPMTLDDPPLSSPSSAYLTTEPPDLPFSPPLMPVPEKDDKIAALVSLLKRYCRLATASYGLHTYIVSPPTPLLTPSGATLPHRLFAHLGGLEDHHNVLHVALQKRYTGVSPSSDGDEGALDAIYAPQFYLLRDDVEGQIVCVIRGTQSLADICTDLDGSFVNLDLPSLDPSSTSSSPPYRIHSGILTAARHLLDPTHSPLFAKLAAILTEHSGYSLVLTGHSLGGAMASTLGVLLGTYYSTDAGGGRWLISPDSGLPALRPLRAICFAHPTTVNAPLAARCAVGAEAPLVVSLSLGSDVICRMGIPHVREVRRSLGRLDRVRKGGEKVVPATMTKDEKTDDEAVAATKTPGVLTSWWRWRKLVAAENKRQEEGELEEPQGAEELAALEDAAWSRRSLVEGWTDDGASSAEDDVDTAIPAGKSFHLDRLPPDVERKRREERRQAEVDEGAEHDEDIRLLGLYEVRDPKAFYAAPVLSSDLIKAHLPKEYLDACESL
ncbi:hypothetical protein JCM1840_006515 [Sporobolomyces johnsonii]